MSAACTQPVIEGREVSYRPSSAESARSGSGPDRDDNDARFIHFGRCIRLSPQDGKPVCPSPRDTACHRHARMKPASPPATPHRLDRCSASTSLGAYS